MNREQIIEDLKSDEGFVGHVYLDHLGYSTIGYGFLVDERRGGRIPKTVANLWLGHEVDWRWAELEQALPWLDGQPEQVQRALLNMAYQLGIGGLLKFKRMLAALKDGDRQSAALEALNSAWAHQTPERAQRVAEWIRGDG